jgi:hypothetical protein
MYGECRTSLYKAPLKHRPTLASMHEKMANVSWTTQPTVSHRADAGSDIAVSIKELLLKQGHQEGRLILASCSARTQEQWRSNLSRQHRAGFSQMPSHPMSISERRAMLLCGNDPIVTPASPSCVNTNQRRTVSACSSQESSASRLGRAQPIALPGMQSARHRPSRHLWSDNWGISESHASSRPGQRAPARSQRGNQASPPTPGRLYFKEYINDLRVIETEIFQILKLIVALVNNYK